MSGLRHSRRGKGISLKKPYVIAGLAVAALFLGAVSVDSSSNAGPIPYDRPTITLEEIVNSVEVRLTESTGNGSANLIPAEIGFRLFPGDGIITHVRSEAKAEIVVQNTTRYMRTTPNTFWRVGDYGKGDEGTVIELDGGTVYIFDEETPEGRPPLKIITPAGTATARGTWMSVHYDPEKGTAKLQCFRGSCELENEHGV